jgi:hypothetical protein
LDYRNPNNDRSICCGFFVFTAIVEQQKKSGIAGFEVFSVTF